MTITTLISDIHYFLPEVFLIISAMLLLILGVFQKNNTNANGSVGWLSIIVAGIAVFLVIAGSPSNPMLLFNNLIVHDYFAVILKVLILIGAMVGVLYAMVDFEGQRAWRFELPILILLASIGMMVMVSANNFMTLYMGLELQSLALYILAAFKRDTERSSEAGLKYFVLGALASGLFLYGASLLYGYTGGFGFDYLKAAHEGGIGSGGLLGIIFILAGLAFKVSAVPFHMWTPDVYEGSPTAVTAFFSMAPKVAALGILVRVLWGPLTDSFHEWQQIILLLSVASMVTGAFAAIAQDNIKRLLAYSSIGHVGYMLMALAIQDTSVALPAMIFYLMIYFVTTAGAFGVLIYLRHQNRSLETMDDLSGLSKNQPLMAVMMAIFMFSMAGIPPLAGFFGKFYVFQVVVDAELYWLAIIGVLTSVVAAYYYLRIVKIMYFDDPIEPTDVAGHPLMRWTLYACALFLVVSVFDLNGLIDILQGTTSFLTLYEPV